jgi:hypothetical protein
LHFSKELIRFDFQNCESDQAGICANSVRLDEIPVPNTPATDSAVAQKRRPLPIALIFAATCYLC